MTSSSYMLERELLGSSRAIIDAHSNNTLVQPTYRTPYGSTNGLSYPTTTTGYPTLGFSAPPMDSYEPKKALTDVRKISRPSIEGIPNVLFSSLVTRSDSNFKTRSAKKR